MAFNDFERRELLLVRGIGPLVIERLESIGLDSFDKILDVGIDEAVERACLSTGSSAWRNRRRALLRAVSHAVYVSSSRIRVYG